MAHAHPLRPKLQQLWTTRLEIRATGLVALSELGAGILLAILAGILAGWGVVGLAGAGWPGAASVSGSLAPTLLSGGFAVALSAGWVVCALCYLDRSRAHWAAGGVMAGVLALGVSLLPHFMPSLGMSEHLALGFGALVSLVGGLWLADSFGCLHRGGITAALAGSIWLTMVVLLIFPGVLAPGFAVLTPLLLSLPLLGAAIVGRDHVPVRSTGVLVGAIVALPMALGLSVSLVSLAFGLA